MEYKVVLLTIANLLLIVRSSEILDETQLIGKDYKEWGAAINGLKQGVSMGKLDDEVKLNKYRDEIRDKMMSFMENVEITDTYPLEDSDVQLSSMDKLQLSHGTVSHFDKIHIPKDENIDFNSSLDTLTWDIPLEFNNLQYNYQYNSKMASLDDGGVIKGSISNPKYLARISYNVKDSSFSLDELVSKGMGSVSPRITELEKRFFLTDLAYKAVQFIYQQKINYKINEIVYKVVDKIFNGLNVILEQLYTPIIDYNQEYLDY